MALVGLDLFRERFVQHNNSFVLIGGTACLVAMELLGLEFRACSGRSSARADTHSERPRAGVASTIASQSQRLRDTPR